MSLENLCSKSLTGLLSNSIVVVDCQNLSERKDDADIEKMNGRILEAEVDTFERRFSNLWVSLQRKCNVGYEDDAALYSSGCVMGYLDVRFVSLADLAMSATRRVFPKEMNAARLVVMNDRNPETHYGQAFVDAAREQGLKAPVLAPLSYVLDAQMPVAPRCLISGRYMDQLKAALNAPAFLRDAENAIVFGLEMPRRLPSALTLLAAPANV